MALRKSPKSDYGSIKTRNAVDRFLPELMLKEVKGKLRLVGDL